jgi:hypothetical protein
MRDFSFGGLAGSSALLCKTITRMIRFNPGIIAFSMSRLTASLLVPVKATCSQNLHNQLSSQAPCNVRMVLVHQPHPYSHHHSHAHPHPCLMYSVNRVISFVLYEVATAEAPEWIASHTASTTPSWEPRTTSQV